MPRDGLADIEDGRDVGAHQLLESLRVEVLQRAAVLHAGVVDQNVDGAGPGFMVIHGRTHRRMIGCIEGQRGDRGPGLLQPLSRGGEPRLVASVQDDARSGAGETFGQCVADSLRRAGDQCRLARQIEQFRSGHHQSGSSFVSSSGMPETVGSSTPAGCAEDRSCREVPSGPGNL